MRMYEAIEIMHAYIDDPLITNKPDFIDALKLATEALQMIIEFRKTWCRDILYHLPSETDD